ncbi:MAG: phoR, partial [Caulobacteraceae bacterium]|nr:phoR [Caulobacteraceae bacterium]
MTESPPPSPSPTGAPRRWRLGALVAVGMAAPLALALTGQASPLAAVIVAAGAAAAGGALLAIGRPPPPPPPPAPVVFPVERPWTPPFRAMLDRLADPILLIQGGQREDLSGRRFLFANAAARALLRIQRQEGPLTTAIRTPEVLDAVDEALYGGAPSEAVYDVR